MHRSIVKIHKHIDQMAFLFSFARGWVLGHGLIAVQVLELQLFI